MQFTKIIRGIAAGALVLAALGAHAHTAQNTPLEKIDFQSAVCTLAQEAQVIDASEENAFLYGECASGTTINPYKFVDADGRIAKLVVSIAKVIYKGGDVAATVAGIAENVGTIMSPTASALEKVGAIADIALDVTTGVNTKEIKAGVAAAEKGIVYLRTNAKTGEKYVGQAKSEERFAKRQGEHDKSLGTEHEYEVLGKATPGKKLDVLEEKMIRENGGIQREGGELVNKRHQMSEKNYRENGGE